MQAFDANRSAPVLVELLESEEGQVLCKGKRAVVPGCGYVAALSDTAALACMVSQFPCYPSLGTGHGHSAQTMTWWSMLTVQTRTHRHLQHQRRVTLG